MNSPKKLLAILNKLATSPYRYGVTELSQQIGCVKSGVHKLLSVLVREEFIEQLEDKKYRLGMRAFLIGKAYEDHVGTWHFCVPYLEKIRDTINENTVFGSWVDGIPKILYRAESRLGFRSVTAIGSSRPINSSAIGKALAAYKDPVVILEMIKSMPLQKYTSKTIVDPQKLFLEYARIRKQGYSINNEEGAPGLISIGVPVKDMSGDVWAVISINAPKVRVNEKKINKYIMLLRDTSGRITDQMKDSVII